MSNIRKILSLLLEQSLRLTQTQSGAIGIFDSRGGTYYVVNHDNFFVDDTSHQKLMEDFLPAASGITRCVRMNNIPIIIDNVAEPAHFPEILDDCRDTYVQNRSNTKSEMIIPLVLDNGVMYGIMNIQSPYTNWFSEELQRLVIAYVSQATARIQNELNKGRVKFLQQLADVMTQASPGTTAHESDDYASIVETLFSIVEDAFSLEYKHKDETIIVP